MYYNIGVKIKTLAKILAWVGIILSIIIAIIFFIMAEEVSETFIPVGLIILFLGPLFSWISSFFMYGYGELIDKTSKIESYVCDHKKSDVQLSNDTKRLEKLNELRAKNLITEEEYLKSVNKDV